MRLLFGALAVVWGCQPAAAQPSSTELAVKATFLVKFASYVTWPRSTLPPGAPIVICVVGKDPFGDVLAKAATGQEANGHSIAVRRVATTSQVGTCHFTYLGGPSRDVTLALSAIGSRPIVTVSDARSSNVAAMIHFQLIEGRVKFDIDASAASRANVEISSKLLGLARRVRSEKSR